jgi:hypothetical protein
MSRKFQVCLDPEIEDVEIFADKVAWRVDTGWLQFFRDGSPGPIAVFPPGWKCLQEIV